MTDFGLKLEPSERVVIANKKLGEEPAHTTLKINNDGKDRCAFKVKCTSNELFRIRPPLGILRNGDSTSVALTFNGGKTVPESGKHYVAIYYIKVGDDKKTARQFWQDHKGEPTGTKRLYVDFKKEDAVAAADANNNEKDKKEEGKKDEKDKKEEKEKKDDEKKEEGGDKKDEEKKDDDKKEEKKEDEKKEEEKKDDDKKEDDKKEDKKE
uniref:Major sperm protein n=1 Tax=Panagrolaimus sp. ES5 TaxID=591445 RepID=A0AC34G6K6_9BILA